MANGWYVFREPEPLGPLSASELRKMAAEGALNSSSLVSIDGKVWRAAGSIRGLELSVDGGERSLAKPSFRGRGSAPAAGRPSAPSKTRRQISDLNSGIQETGTGSPGPTAPTKPSYWHWALVTIGLVVGITILDSVFAPLKPRELCQRVIGAKSIAEAEAFVTEKMRPALPALITNDGRFRIPWETVDFLGDRFNSPVLGGDAMVRCRFNSRTGDGRPFFVEAAFHLRPKHSWGRHTWLVDDVLLLNSNGRRFDPPVPVTSLDAQAGAAAPAKPATPNSTSKD
jgi:hypothetical protein